MQCLYCEKTFRDKTTLKDHMRKKQHRRINARNNVYDRFYIINYLVHPYNYIPLRLLMTLDLNLCVGLVEIFVLVLQELGKTWEEVQSEDDRDLLEDEDE